MNAALLRHAIDNIWCNPGQDRQFVYKLVNLKPYGSVRNQFITYYERVVLPTQNEYYHIYQMGKVNPTSLGLPQVMRTWMSLSWLMNEKFLFTDIYTADGIMYPRGHAYLWLTPNGNLLIAVKENRRVGMLYEKDLFLRFYSNAFFQSERSDGRRYLIHRQHTVTDINTLIGFQREMSDLRSDLGGIPYYFVNGRFVSNISPITAGEDDVCEFIMDGSVRKLVEFDIVNQPTFTSEKDDVNKYLLHPPKDGAETAKIDYLDDVDAFLINPTMAGRFTGVTYHRNHPAWMSMVTHRDYGVPVSRFNEFVAIHPTDPRHQLDPIKWAEDRWNNVEGKKLRLYIRDSGYDRPLIPNANRLLELYRLPSERIIKAMTGADGAIDVWLARNLETSDYVKLMSMHQSLIYPVAFNDPEVSNEQKKELQELVGQAYGYHASAALLADSPYKPYLDSGARYVDLRFEHQHDVTIFEYDAEGLLIDWYLYSGGTRWLVQNSNCRLVEAIIGHGVNDPVTVEGTDDVEVPDGYNVRVYVRPKRHGIVYGEWQDITMAENRHEWGFFDYLSSPRVWRWTKPVSEFHGAVRNDAQFLCYPVTLVKGDGTLQLSLEVQKQLGPYPSGHTLEIPYGQLDVFMNQRLLTEGVDYTVRFPEIVIQNIEYLNDPDPQAILVRMCGFPPSLDTPIARSEVGFVRHGVLSNNQQYDLHSNKVRRVVIDGRMLHRDDVVFDEQKRNYVTANVRNGSPYFIQTPPITLRNVFDDDYKARRDDDLIDQAVAAYMTEHFALTEYTDPNSIPRRYQVASVFANSLLRDLRSGAFYPTGIEGEYSHLDIRQWCKDYEWLLPYDICNTDYDEFHINVRPHWETDPVAINLFRYQFFYRALEVYLRHPPALSPYVTIS